MITFTHHARKRMEERLITTEEVKRTIYVGKSAGPHDEYEGRSQGALKVVRGDHVVIVAVTEEDDIVVLTTYMKQGI